MSNSVPTPLTSFIGREREVARVCALLRNADVRLLTLTGPGGVGKTRLALAVTAAMAADYADGAHFVPLAAVRDHQLVASVLARAVGVPELNSLPFADQVRAAAHDIEALLLIDNFEHLLPAAPLLTELLAACPRLKLLVTSRERLRVSGERDEPVLPLAYPDPEHLPSLKEVATAPAVRLFAERAHATDPGFTLTDDNTAAVAAICHRLDGLPLALELAAARSPHLTPAALLARLARRLPLLTGGPRDVPDRLRTMRDAIIWSYDLLTAEEQILFRRVAVFAGGCTLDAAGAIAEGGKFEGGSSVPLLDRSLVSSVLDGIASLVDKSLLRRIYQHDLGSAEGGETPRFEMLETIREFGLEQLAASGEEDEIRSAHATYYLALVGDLTSRRSNEQAVFDHLEMEHANLRAALAWFDANGSSGDALQLATHLGRFWLRRGHQLEGRVWLERVLAPDADPRLRSAALNAAGNLLLDLGENFEAQRTFELALGLARAISNRREEATALDGLSALSDDVGDDTATKSFSEASTAIWRELCDDRGLAHALNKQGWAEAGMGNIRVAFALFHEALNLAREVGDDQWVAHVLGSLGNLHSEQGEFDAALPYLEEGLAVARAVRDRPEMAEITGDLGWLALELGDADSARTYFEESLALLRETGRRRDLVIAIEGCAVLAATEGNRDLADRLVIATAAIRDEMGVPVERDPRLIASGPTTARIALKRLAATSTSGQVWSTDEAMREAEAFVSMPHVSDGHDPNTAYGLSPREMDVLKLLVTGQSDRAIADTLFISRRTASKHVGAILAKLDVTTRTEAAARAVRDGFA